MKSNEFNPINIGVDAVYVLSVKSFEERIHHIKLELAKHHIQFEFMFDDDASDIQSQDLTHIFDSTELSVNQKSLILKNIRVWKDALVKKYDTVLIFEDDALLKDDFVYRFDIAIQASKQLDKGWLIFLGGDDVKVPDHYFLALGPLVKMPICTTEAYVSDITAMQRRLNWLENNKIKLPADHLIRLIDEQMLTAQYWLTHPIVEQGSSTGLFDSSLDMHKQKHGKLFTKFRNRWNILRRQHLRRLIVRINAKLALHSTKNRY